MLPEPQVEIWESYAVMEENGQSFSTCLYGNVIAPSCSMIEVDKIDKMRNGSSGTVHSFQIGITATSVQSSDLTLNITFSNHVSSEGYQVIQNHVASTH